MLIYKMDHSVKSLYVYTQRASAQIRRRLKGELGCVLILNIILSREGSQRKYTREKLRDQSYKRMKGP